ncbi:MAG: hypothetical protein ACM3O3_06355 [Syntrophothermus sp.]
MKKILLIGLLLLVQYQILPNEPPADKARGVFLSFGVGPRIPLGVFSNTTDLGYGLNIEVSYTDNEYLPFFLFARVGYEQFPGSQQYYQSSDYSNFSTTSIPISAGLRYYFAPLMENVVLFMPVIEAGVSFNYYQNLHEFKPSSGRSNFNEEHSKLGFTAGVGLSMFMLEILANYNYFQTNQYINLDLKVRLPLFMVF